MTAPGRRLEVQRWVPGRDDAPRWQAWDLPAGFDGSLLDALAYLKDHEDPTLAWRWSCRMGICGSCGMMVDDEPRLACEVFVRDLPVGTTRIAPLTHLPVERDLIVDQREIMARIARARPWLEPRPDLPKGPVGENLQPPAQGLPFKDLSHCIDCLLCYSACPQVGLTEDFLGPAAIAHALRYDLDSRDAGSQARNEAIQAPEGAWACTVVGACSTACPKAVDPASAIQQQKVRGLVDWARAMLRPGGRGGREGE